MANAVVSQSGGPTGVINASLVGVIEETSKHNQIDNLYGAIHAVAGIVKEDFVDLKKLSGPELEKLAASPSAALGSSRDKPDEEYCRKILDVFKKHDIRYFYYNGGNDSANTCHIINNMADETGYELHAFHVPKTVDNDLLVTDHCPGFGSAAKFVATAFRGDDIDNRAIPGIKINVLMGRHAGFLTASSALARERDDDGPHLIYMPERPVSMEQFLSDVESVYKRLGRCVVAISEGISAPDGKTWAEKLNESAEKDAHGNIQLSGTGALADYMAGKVKSEIKANRVRADTFGYLQRSFAGMQSKTDVEEARACGIEAVKYSMDNSSGSVAMKRTGTGDNYGIEYFLTELSNVAEKTKEMADEFISADGNDVTDAFIEYAKPLAGELPRTTWLGSLPRIK